MEVTLDIEPEFDLPNYKDYELTVEPTEVKEDDVTKELDTIREQRASFDVVDAILKMGIMSSVPMRAQEGKAVAEILPEKPMYSKRKQHLGRSW